MASDDGGIRAALDFACMALGRVNDAELLEPRRSKTLGLCNWSLLTTHDGEVYFFVRIRVKVHEVFKF